MGGLTSHFYPKNPTPFVIVILLVLVWLYIKFPVTLAIMSGVSFIIILQIIKKS
jgi:hypothetical protein